MNDFNITLPEVCEMLNRSKKSISRYIGRGLLHPIKIKNQNGILEYRFSKSDIEAFKIQEAQNASNKIHNIKSYESNLTDNSNKIEQDKIQWTMESEYNTVQTTSHLINKSDIDSKILNDSGHQWTQKDIVDTSGQDNSGQERIEGDKKGQNTEIITLLKETVGLLKEQLSKKDEQIKDLGFKIDQLIERDRETNILIGHLQNKVLMLEKLKDSIDKESQRTLVDTKRQDMTRHDKTQIDTGHEMTQTTINQNSNENSINYSGHQWTRKDIVDTSGQDNSGQERTKKDTGQENKQNNFIKKGFFTIIRNFFKVSK